MFLLKLFYSVGTASSEDEASKGARKKQKKGASVVSAAGATTGSGSQGDSSTLSHPADVLDMPVDPNEPTYCVCNQVSYGEMIGCDNPDVSIVINCSHLRTTCNLIDNYFFSVWY